MSPEQVDQTLANYKRKQARAAHLKSQLAVMERNLENAREAAMSGDVLHGQNLDPTPHGNLPGNPTESLVLRYLDGYTPIYLKDQEKAVKRAKNELFDCEIAVELVADWMLCLSERERFVITEHILNEKTWREVLKIYEEQFGEFGQSGLKKLKKRALNKIYEVAV